MEVWSCKLLRFCTYQSHFPEVRKESTDEYLRKTYIHEEKISFLTITIFDTHIVSCLMLVKRSRKETLNSSSLIWKDVDANFNASSERNVPMAIRSFDADSGRAIAASLQSFASPSATFSMAESQRKLLSVDADSISSVYNSFATAKFPVRIASGHIWELIRLLWILLPSIPSYVHPGILQLLQ